MGVGAEGQPGETLETGLDAYSFVSPSTVKVKGDRTLSGLNTNDQIVVTGGLNGGTFNISALSYDGLTDITTITVMESTIISDAYDSVSVVSTQIDPNKNLRRDLDHIRTQIRLLNRKPNWYDPPQADDVVKYQLKTGTAYAAGEDIILSGGEVFDAGQPYTLKVYLNGQLLLPSTISGTTLITSYDYSERNASGYVGIGAEGDRIRFNFEILSTDVIQFKWTKTQ
jgi:hypothetical protein